jgi:hypothetical protein
VAPELTSLCSCSRSRRQFTPPCWTRRWSSRPPPERRSSTCCSPTASTLRGLRPTIGSGASVLAYPGRVASARRLAAARAHPRTCCARFFLFLLDLDPAMSGQATLRWVAVARETGRRGACATRDRADGGARPCPGCAGPSSSARPVGGGGSCVGRETGELRE